MLRYVSILLLSVLVAAAPLEAAQDEPAQAQAIVNRVIDGDTLDVAVDGVRTPVGLLGAAAPLLNQPCGAEAAARMSELVPAAATISLVADPAYSGLDARRRLLYYVFASDGTSIDQTLVAEGLAHAAGADAADAATLTGLEQDAQANARGCLWAG